MDPYKHLKRKVNSLLTAEATLTDDERATMQWQLLATIGKRRLLVGKGGVNTMFYRFDLVNGDSVQEGERHICYPHEMLERLDAWSSREYEIYLITRSKTRHLASYQTLDSAKQHDDVPDGHYIVGVTRDGKMKKLYVRKRGLKASSWSKV